MNFIDSLKRSIGMEEKSLKPDIEKELKEDSYDDNGGYITPEQSFYEILLFRPKIQDDIDYVVDQIVEEQNPVIVDIAYLEEYEEGTIQKVSDTLKILKEEYRTEVILLCKNEEKHMLLISPPRVKILKKE
ncbi:cell division protein SepF [Methanobrevibacter filiformis]|uniref:Cell division protein SepF n=1 Tax=Methanobrevibacter filiformis TaxID=55758 RepID=A0A166C7W9_9EURY|nr:cell division protein SepF [Methanobrevibacter filiformis]KZX12027.1 hypothetical protein MBFIL_12590 [Methanobrevibacter filiformis]